MTQFHKMHGLGNDFVVVDARVDAITITPQRARAIADRHRGIGCDQLIVIEPGALAQGGALAGAPVDATMRIWNADGSEVESCGNAARAVGMLIGDAVLMTRGGPITVRTDAAGAQVDMGVPRFAWDAVPLAYPIDTTALPIGWDGLERPLAINVGNPHLVFFVSDVDAVDLAGLGPLIEADALFPERINVNVAEVTGPATLTMRTWERGAGLTQGCGTGACAAAVAAIVQKRVAGPVVVEQPGGALTIDWRPGSSILMSGPAQHVFTGEINWEALPA